MDRAATLPPLCPDSRERGRLPAKGSLDTFLSMASSPPPRSSLYAILLAERERSIHFSVDHPPTAG